MFYSKNKFEKLVHLVGFIIRIYHDARSPESQRTNMTMTEWHDSSANKMHVLLFIFLGLVVLTML